MPIEADESFVQDWLGEDTEVLRDAVEKRHNIAVVSEPLGGRERILEYALGRTNDKKIEKTRFEPTGQTDDTFPETDLVHVYEEPQHLYRRRIGGYDRLDTFLDAVASAEESVITSWNVFSWRYVSRVRGAGSLFPVVVESPPVGAELLDDLLPDAQPSISQKDIQDAHSTFLTREFLPTRVQSFGESVSFPWLMNKDEASPREILIESIRSESGGNPGVAEALWEKIPVPSEETGEDKQEEGSVLGDVFGNTKEVFDDSTAFALRTVLSKEEVTKDELRETAGVENVDRAVRNLSEKGYICSQQGNEVLKPEPTRIPKAVGILTRRDALW